MNQPESQRVFICSKYAGDIEHNVLVAQALCRMAVEAGLAPFAPHLLYTQFLDDSNNAQRDLGISMGLRFMETCDSVWVYVGEGVSDGMRREIEHARSLGKPVVILREVRPCVLI
ncbi:MAG: DUF7768 domain-containing protein [Armatimonadota bacterium]